jgi:thiosulfate/3-mercaptopyruvate sulfurtransferase
MTLPDVLVDADWVQANLDEPGVVLIEVDEDTSRYDQGHITGAVKFDWKQDLEDPVTRGFIDQAGFEALLSERGIATDDTVILYGGRNNWFAAYAYWYFKVYGHRTVRLLDGGRSKWELDSREMVTEVRQRPATVYRAQKPERWMRTVIRARSQGTWPPRQRRRPWQELIRRSAPSVHRPGEPPPVKRGELTAAR